MSFERMKPFWIGATVFGVLFAVLLSIRLNPIQSSPSISPLPEFKKNDAAGPNYFIDYAQKSADIAKKICHRFRFSNREKDFVDGIIRSHIRPLGLYKTRQNNHFPDRLISFF